MSASFSGRLVIDCGTVARVEHATRMWLEGESAGGAEVPSQPATTWLITSTWPGAPVEAPDRQPATGPIGPRGAPNEPSVSTFSGTNVAPKRVGVAQRDEAAAGVVSPDQSRARFGQNAHSTALADHRLLLDIELFTRSMRAV